MDGRLLLGVVVLRRFGIGGPTSVFHRTLLLQFKWHWKPFLEQVIALAFCELTHGVL